MTTSHPTSPGVPAPECAVPSGPRSGSLVGDLARREPATIRIFQRHGIDFCCGGRITLAEACERHGVDLATLQAELAACEFPETAAEPQWSERPSIELVGHILSRYHSGLREELARLQAMAERAADRHGDRHRELVDIRDLVGRLAAAFGEHLDTEEREIFPALMRGETPPREELLGAEQEHAEVGALLARLRAVTDGYVPPPHACNTWRGLFHGLGRLEADTHQHVHLENNVLFPRFQPAAGA